MSPFERRCWTLDMKFTPFGDFSTLINVSICAVISIQRNLTTICDQAAFKDVTRMAEIKTALLKNKSLDTKLRRYVFSVESRVSSRKEHKVSRPLAIWLWWQKSMIFLVAANATSCANRKSDYVKKFLAVFFLSVLSASSYKIRKRFEVQPIFTMFDFLVKLLLFMALKLSKDSYFQLLNIILFNSEISISQRLSRQKKPFSAPWKLSSSHPRKLSSNSRNSAKLDPKLFSWYMKSNYFLQYICTLRTWAPFMRVWVYISWLYFSIFKLYHILKYFQMHTRIYFILFCFIFRARFGIENMLHTRLACHNGICKAVCVFSLSLTLTPSKGKNGWYFLLMTKFFDDETVNYGSRTLQSALQKFWLKPNLKLFIMKTSNAVGQ